MVEIRISRDSRGRLSSFFATGHAGWGEYGTDVVCAAISTTLQSVWLGLTDVLAIPVVADKAEGELRLTWPADTRDDPGVRAIVTTAARTLETLARQFPKTARVIYETDE